MDSQFAMSCGSMAARSPSWLRRDRLMSAPLTMDKENARGTVAGISHFMTRLLAISTLAAAPLIAGPVDYNRDIQPILAENCYHCHGPDAKQRKAKLRLDQKDGPDGAYRTDEGITVVKPGSS